MAITSLDTLIAGIGNNSQGLVFNKATITNQVAGNFVSMWTATGWPFAGVAPTTVAIPTAATTGAMGINNATSGETNYLARLFLLSSIAGTDVQVHDRLSHAGGLSGTSTSAQTVTVNAAAAGLVDRIGSADYGDVQFWLEWYTDTGATAVGATCAVVYDNGSTGDVVVSLPATMRRARMMPILPAANGRRIRQVTSVTLSATTGAAGNFGVTATRAMCGISLGLANYGSVSDWAMLGLPKLADDVCLQFVVITSTTSSGAIYGSGKVAAG